jgi:flagellar basal body-associated protein FliL
MSFEMGKDGNKFNKRLLIPIIVVAVILVVVILGLVSPGFLTGTLRSVTVTPSSFRPSKP